MCSLSTLETNCIHPGKAPSSYRFLNSVDGSGFSGRMMLMTGLVQAMSGAESATAAIAEPEIQSRTSPGQGDPANDWLCSWCLARVASEKDRFSHEGQSEFTLKNPEGIRFDILTFLRTIGCKEVGVPTLEHTWFPGHAWSYCLCDRCRMHLGWYYAGPREFAGLIRDRIVRASVVMS